MPENLEVRLILPYAFERSVVRSEIDAAGEGSLYITPLAVTGRPALRTVAKIVSIGPDGTKPYELRIAKDGALSLRFLGDSPAEPAEEASTK